MSVPWMDKPSKGVPDSGPTRLLGQSQLSPVPVSARSLPYPLVASVLFFQEHFPAAFPSLSRHHSCRTPSPWATLFSFIPLHQIVVVAGRRSIVVVYGCRVDERTSAIQSTNERTYMQTISIFTFSFSPEQTEALSRTNQIEKQINNKNLYGMLANTPLHLAGWSTIEHRRWITPGSGVGKVLSWLRGFVFGFLPRDWWRVVGGGCLLLRRKLYCVKKNRQQTEERTIESRFFRVSFGMEKGANAGGLFCICVALHYLAVVGSKKESWNIFGAEKECFSRLKNFML